MEQGQACHPTGALDYLRGSEKRARGMTGSHFEAFGGVRVKNTRTCMTCEILNFFL